MERIASLAFLAVVLGLTAAAGQTFESGPGRTHLLELYTSEGCSSCPPAEAWLSRLKNNPRLWRDFAPLAFHVDYWDRLGWRDLFASKKWTDRQYQYSQRWNQGSVYTPGFVLDGREWQNNGVPSAANESPGSLKIEVANGQLISATFATRSSAPLALHVARLGFGLKVDVRAGENRGRKLEHDFVVLALETANMNDGKGSLRMIAHSVPANRDGRSALVAWVTAGDSLDSIQATGGWLQ